MDEVTLWLEGLFDSHVRPDPRITHFHQDVLDTKMRRLEERLLKTNKMFEGVRLEMAGSVLNSTKVGESDEFDVNAVIKLPIDESDLNLVFDKSSPGYAQIQVQKDVVDRVQGDCSIFAGRNNNFYISSGRLDSALKAALSEHMNSQHPMLKHPLTSLDHQSYKANLTYDCNMFGDIIVHKTEAGWEYAVDMKDFTLDLAPCVHLPIKALKNHPTISGTLENIQRIFPDLNLHDIDVRLVPKTSPAYFHIKVPVQQKCFLKCSFLHFLEEKHFFWYFY